MRPSYQRGRRARQHQLGLAVSPYGRGSPRRALHLGAGVLLGLLAAHPSAGRSTCRSGRRGRRITARPRPDAVLGRATTSGGAATWRTDAGRARRWAAGGVLAAASATVLAACSVPAPPGDAPLRYRDKVFTGVTVASDVVYGNAPDLTGTPVDLKARRLHADGRHPDEPPGRDLGPRRRLRRGDKTQAPFVKLATQFAQRGYVALSINYRLMSTEKCAGVHPPPASCQAAAVDAQHDAQAAVRWLRAHAAKYGVDPDRIAIGGGSAGAATSRSWWAPTARTRARAAPRARARRWAAWSRSPASCRRGPGAARPGRRAHAVVHRHRGPAHPRRERRRRQRRRALQRGRHERRRGPRGAGHVPLGTDGPTIYTQSAYFLYFSLDLAHAAGQPPAAAAATAAMARRLQARASGSAAGGPVTAPGPPVGSPTGVPPPRRRRPRVELVPTRGLPRGGRVVEAHRRGLRAGADRRGPGRHRAAGRGGHGPRAAPRSRSSPTSPPRPGSTPATRSTRSPPARSATRERGASSSTRPRDHRPAVRVLSREEEARYGYLAAVNSTTLTDGAVLDLGGGSLQLVRVDGAGRTELGSWPLGAVRMTEHFLPGDGPAKASSCAALRAHVAERARPPRRGCRGGDGSSASAARCATSPPPRSARAGCRSSASRASS